MLQILRAQRSSYEEKLGYVKLNIDYSLFYPVIFYLRKYRYLTISQKFSSIIFVFIRCLILLSGTKVNGSKLEFISICIKEENQRIKK